MPSPTFHAPSPSPLCRLGHVATAAEIIDTFGGRNSILAVFRPAYGVVRRLRTGLYICAHLDEQELTAAWCGGRLDCVTVLAELGLPVTDFGELHLRLRRGDGRASARRHADAPTTHVHWSRPRTPLVPLDQIIRLGPSGGRSADRLRMPVPEALRQAMTSCLSYQQSAEVLEAMLSSSHSAEDLARVVLHTSRRVQSALRRIGGLPAEVRLSLDALTLRNHF